MMAGPSPVHQDLLLELAIQLHGFLKGTPCRAHIAPFEVRLFPKEDGSDNTYVEPDIFVVCDKSKIDRHGCKGAPDFVVEILSPSSRSMDLLYKLNKYRDAGVREYWVIDPEETLVMVYIFDEGKTLYTAYSAKETEKLEVTVLKGCFIDLKALFASLEVT
jgi:Uma2 family endonuclease